VNTVKRACIACCLVAWLPWGPAAASTFTWEGIITSVAADGSSIVVMALNHYGMGMDKLAERTIKFSPETIFILDNQVVPREVALAPGRKFCAFGPCWIATLSEAGTVLSGKVKSVSADGKSAVLALPIKNDELLDKPVSWDENAVWMADGKAVAKENVLKVGQAVRFLAGRRQTLEVLSEQALAKRFPEKGHTASVGVVKVMDPQGGAVLLVSKGGKDSELAVARKGMLVVDACYRNSGHASKEAVDAAWAEMAAVGRGIIQVRAQKRPGKFDDFVIGVSDDPGRTVATVKNFDADKGTLVVSARGADGPKDVTVDLAKDAVVRLDGKASTAAEALKAGRELLLYSTRPMTMQTLTAAAPKAGAH